MKSYSINVGMRTSRGKASDAARRAIQRRGEELTLLSWYDLKEKIGGPMELDESLRARSVADYARSHGAQYSVRVNNGSYEFFFTRIPRTVTQLNRAAVIANHREFVKNVYDNIQGG